MSIGQPIEKNCFRRVQVNPDRDQVAFASDPFKRPTNPVPQAGRVKDYRLAMVQQFLNAAVESPKKALVLRPIITRSAVDYGAPMLVDNQDYRVAAFANQLGEVRFTATGQPVQNDQAG